MTHVTRDVARLREAIEEGFRCIAAKFNTILGEKGIERRIAIEHVREEDSLRRAERRVVAPLENLRRELDLGASVYDEALWCLGYVNWPDPTLMFCSLNTSGRVDVACRLLRDRNWTQREWQDRIIEPIERQRRECMAHLARIAPKRRRWKAENAKTRPLTARQAEAMHMVGECEGNFSAAGKRMGLAPKTVRQHYNTALRKLGRASLKHVTKSLPADSRGQVNISKNDD